MCEKVFFCLIFILFQGGIKNGLKAGRRCSAGWCLGHDNGGDYSGTDQVVQRLVS